MMENQQAQLARIQACNPGALSADDKAFGARVSADGAVIFPTALTGLAAAASKMHNVYIASQNRSAFELAEAWGQVGYMSPKLRAYTLIAHMNLSDSAIMKYDIRLDRAWNALAVMLGIIELGCGRPGPHDACYPCWYSPAAILEAMAMTGHWDRYSDAGSVRARRLAV